MSDLLDSQKINELEAFFRKRVAWQSFTPTLHQTATIAATVTDGRYYADDGKVHVMATLTATAAASAGGIGVYIVLPTYLAPATGINTSIVLGTYSANDVGTAWNVGFASQHTTVGGLPAIGGIADGSAVAIGTGFTIATGDIVSVNLTYRLA